MHTQSKNRQEINLFYNVLGIIYDYSFYILVEGGELTSYSYFFKPFSSLFQTFFKFLAQLVQVFVFLSFFSGFFALFSLNFNFILSHNLILKLRKMKSEVRPEMGIAKFCKDFDACICISLINISLIIAVISREYTVYKEFITF